jgi:hypothetical protein
VRKRSVCNEVLARHTVRKRVIGRRRFDAKWQKMAKNILQAHQRMMMMGALARGAQGQAKHDTNVVSLREKMADKERGNVAHGRHLW